MQARLKKMSMIDRRSGNDRRDVPRYPVRIEIEWEGDTERKTGTLNDLSTEGCFVLCSGEVEDGTEVKLYFPLTDGMKVQLLGEVVNHIYEIGFAVKFIEIDVGQRDFLSKYVDELR